MNAVSEFDWFVWLVLSDCDEWFWVILEWFLSDYEWLWVIMSDYEWLWVIMSDFVSDSWVIMSDFGSPWGYFPST